MKMFYNLLFTISSESSHWSNLGFKIKSSDGRIIDIKPIHRQESTEKRKQILFMSSEIHLNYKPKITGENNIILPKNESRELFTSLRMYANLISVTDVCEVSISSPTPSTGFIFESDEEKKFLDNTNGFHSELIAQLSFGNDFFKEIHKDQLLDRIEGVAFLATANSQRDNVARFHEYIRLFERAFASHTEELAKLLHGFLSQTKSFDYTFEELLDWMVDKRHGATHADQRDNFVFSSDLNSDIDRIEQAAYDVLFNKLEWHDKTTTRRTLWTPRRGIVKEGMFIVQQELDHNESITITENDETFYAVEIPEEQLKMTKLKDPPNWWVKWTPPNHYPVNQ